MEFWLHQAIEAKEGVFVRSESKTLATITLQNYFRMYQKLAGMTGTAKTEEGEFIDIYNMDVLVIPTNKPIVREDKADAVFATEKGKYKAIVDRVAEVHATGQPVLVGTISIENSELIANLLSKQGIKNYKILNAKQHDKEAAIIAEAGRENAITIATNMAGRGTDIILGGNPEFEAKADLAKLEIPEEVIAYAATNIPTDDPAILEARAKYREFYDQYKAERADEQQRVIDLGGLCIVGTERHESRRIDNQLRGRAGRQGDPGETQFCISMEDELMRLFGGDKMQNVVTRLGVAEDEAIESGMVSRSIEGAQKKVEARNFGIRKYVLQYDNVMNKQREIIYEERRTVLFGEDLREYIMNMTRELVMECVEPITVASKYAEEWDLDSMNLQLKRICDRFSGLHLTEEERGALTAEDLKDLVMEAFEALYQDKEKELGTERMRELERMILIRVVDNKWMDHIDAMDQLKHGIGLRALGQQDPAAAYAQEGFDMFELMIQNIKEETVKFCYNVTIQTSSERKQILGAGKRLKEGFEDATKSIPGAGGLDMEGDELGQGGPRQQQIPERQNKQETVRRELPKVGRNDPCPCGSGKKYKYCHGREE